MFYKIVYFSALCLLCTSCDRYQLKDPADLGPVPNDRLLKAAYDGDVGLLNDLLEDGAAVNKKSRAGFTPLGYAVYFRHEEAVRVILKYNPDFSQVDRFGFYPLEQAVSRVDLNYKYDDSIEIIRMLVDAGCDPMLTGSGDQIHAPILSAERRNLKDVMYILERENEVEQSPVGE